MRFGPFLASILSLATLAGTTLAQQSKPDDQPLKGPAVKDDSVPGESRRFTGGAVKKKESVGERIPHQAFLRSLSVLKAPDIDPTARLSDEQAGKIEQISRDYRESQRAYMEEHREEIAKIRKKANPELRKRIDSALGEPGLQTIKEVTPSKEKGKAPAKDGDASDESMMQPQTEAEDAAIKTRAAEIAQGAPKATDAHAKIWAVLTASQRPIVEKELARVKKELETRRDGGKKGDAKKKSGADGENIDLSTLPPAMQERLKNMTPEEREKAMERLRNRKKAEAEKKTQSKDEQPK
jgi:hypothetical protein